MNQLLRKSSYVIDVKIAHEEDKYMLLHGYTGAIDIVGGKVLNYLDRMNSSATDSGISLSDATLDALKTRGYLTTKSEEEERAYMRRLADILHRKEKILHKHFMFLIAYDCNFRCPYCYEKNVLKNSRQWSKKVFTKEMADKAYDAISKIGKDRRLYSPRITLYGGEPLLHENKDIVTYIVNKGKELGYTFMAITNGYDLENFKHLLGQDMINFLQITIDGTKEHHDKRRVHYRTKQSFDKIIANIGIALAQDVRVGIRVNTDASNFDDLEKLEQLFRELGYSENPKLSLHSALLFDHNITPKNKNLIFLDQKEFNQRHQNTNYKYQCIVTTIAQTLFKPITNNTRVDLSSVFCSAQAGSYILDPFGEIYSCWEDVGHQEKVIGNYNEDSVEWTAIRDLWQNQHIGMVDGCVDCRYAFFCRGGCISQRIVRNGTFGAGFCNSFPETFELAANLAYREISDKKI